MHVSPRNPLRTRLTMEEKGKAVKLEINEEEEDLEDLIIEVDKDEGMEEETESAHPPTKLPAYIPPWKGKAKVPKDLHENKNSLQTLLLLDDIIFEGMHLGRVPNLKFEDWDLADHEKFPHLETMQLMKPKKNTMVGVIELEPQKWLCRVEKAGLLNLLWVPHYHRAPLTIFIIRQLLFLVHGGCLWLKEPIPIMDHLIHHIT